MSHKHTDDVDFNDADIAALFKNDVDKPDTTLDQTILAAARNTQSQNDKSFSHSRFAQWQVAFVGCAAVVLLTVILVPMHMRTTEPNVEMSSLNEPGDYDKDLQHSADRSDKRINSTVSTVVAGDSEVNQSNLSQESVLANAPATNISDRDDVATDVVTMAAESKQMELARRKAKTAAESLSSGLTTEINNELASREHLPEKPFSEVQNESTDDNEAEYRSTQQRWIAEIKRLYDINNLEQALDELKRFRLAHPDSQIVNRLPAELKALSDKRRIDEK